MKALSLRQPWADLVIQGRKTLELRSWTVSHRGPLAIHASQTVDKAACRAHGLDPDQVATGALIGVIDLVDVAPLDEATFRARQSEHLAGAYKPPLYGWEIRNPRPLPAPHAAPGHMGLFTVPDEWLTVQSTNSPIAQLPNPPITQLPDDSTTRSSDHPTIPHPFELRVVAVAAGANRQTAYNLALFQRMVEPPSAQSSLYAQGEGEQQRMVELGGSVLKAVSDQVLAALKHSGYKATDLQAGRREPFHLDEESGVRLGLLFLAIKPITKMPRVEAIAHGIRAMTSEEAYYWYSKCTRSATADRAQKALRVLLAGD
ncbi:MAG: ASCH domain-containing protein [Anaerolineae bacterium]